jgi:hypothetical protein
MEDSLPHPALPVIIWMMAASSYGDLPWRMTRSHVELILGFVRDIAKCNYHQVLIKLGTAQIRQNPQPTPERNFIRWCLWVRTCYGGMAGDMKMLLGTPCVGSFQCLEEPYHNPIIQINEIAAPFSVSDMISEAVDYHCWPGMLTRLDQCFPHLPRSAMRAALWEHRSGVYTKQIVPPEKAYAYNAQKQSARDKTDLIWAEIKDEVETLSQRYWGRAHGGCFREVVTPFSKPKLQADPNDHTQSRITSFFGR